MKVRMNEAKEAVNKHLLEVSRRKADANAPDSKQHFSSDSYSQASSTNK